MPCITGGAGGPSIAPYGFTRPIARRGPGEHQFPKLMVIGEYRAAAGGRDGTETAVMHLSECAHMQALMYMRRYAHGLVTYPGR